jgi:hypothetical protein
VISFIARDFSKKLRFAASFLRWRMIHVNLQILYECNYRCRICDFWKEGHRNTTRLTAAEAYPSGGRALGAEARSVVELGA